MPLICRRRWVDAGQMTVKASAPCTAVDAGQGLGELESRWTPPPADGMPRERALEWVLRHRARCWRVTLLAMRLISP